ncbi:MAG: type IV secretion protein IcmS [Pseudomonadota bacterium]|nr:type IV secretion protein IcmS [Pseudomonadota bacterium]
MDISKKMCAIAKKMGANFSFNDRPMTHKEVFADTGLLPALSRRADQLCSLCLGYGIGITFDEAEESVLGVKVSFDDVTPSVLRLLCITDVLNELILSSSSREITPLDELMYD